jgi:hypothetical protein
MIDRLRDGLRQDLRQGLIALRFGTTRELIEAAQALEACIVEGQQSQTEVGKMKEINFSSSRPPLSKKGKGQFSQFRRKGGAILGLFRVLVLGLLVDSHLFREVLLEGHQD